MRSPTPAPSPPVRDQADRRRAGRVAWILAGLPPAALVVGVFLWGVDVPFWDQWLLVPLIDQGRQGVVDLDGLWRPHAEHRIFFPRLLMVALAQVSGWNVRWELALDVALAAGVFALVTARLRASSARRGLLARWLGPPLASLLVFNLNQWENWAWGLQMVVFLSTLALVGGLAVLARVGLRTWDLVAAAGLGIVASYSFTTGLLFWPLSLPLVLAARRGRWLRGAVWTGLAIAVVGLYFAGNSPAGATASLPRSAGEVASFAAYPVVYLGAPIAAYDGKLAAGAGLIGCLALAWLLLRLVRRQGPPPGAALWWILLAGYGVGSALLTAAGRWPLGLPLALSSRYLIYSNFFWLGLIGLAAVWPAEPSRRTRVFLRVGVAAAAISLLASSLWGGVLLHQQYLDRTAAREALIADELGPEDPLLFPDNRIPAEFVDTLRRHRLSLFRDDADGGRMGPRPRWPGEASR